MPNHASIYADFLRSGLGKFMDDFIAKPVRPRELAGTLQKWGRLRQQALLVV